MGVVGAIGLLGLGRTNAAFATVFHDRMEPQISAARGEQSDGVVQIGEAVQNMDQAGELVRTVSVFRTGAVLPAPQGAR